MQRAIAVIGVIALVVAMGTVAVVRALDKKTPSELPVMGMLPLFEMKDQKGKYFTPQKLRGHVTIANFIFTRCDAICPAFSMKMRRIQDRTAALGDKLLLVSFTVDPEHDTPEVLDAYATRFKADSKRWKFLTGEPDAVRRTVHHGLKIAMDRRGSQANGAPDIVHGEHFVLFDRELRIRGYYDSKDVKRLDALVRDAEQLIESK